MSRPIGPTTLRDLHEIFIIRLGKTNCEIIRKNLPDGGREQRLYGRKGLRRLDGVVRRRAGRIGPVKWWAASSRDIQRITGNDRIISDSQTRHLRPRMRTRRPGGFCLVDEMDSEQQEPHGNRPASATDGNRRHGGRVGYAPTAKLRLPGQSRRNPDPRSRLPGGLQSRIRRWAHRCQQPGAARRWAHRSADTTDPRDNATATLGRRARFGRGARHVGWHSGPAATPADRHRADPRDGWSSRSTWPTRCGWLEHATSISPSPGSKSSRPRPT